MKIMKAAGWTAATLASLAGYGLTVTSHAHASEPGHAVKAPRWLSFQAATSADRNHFHVHGKCVIELAGSGHGWIICRDGQSAKISGPGPEPARITLVTARTGLALGSLRWSSAGRASGELRLTGEGAADIGRITLAARRTASGSLASLAFAGDIGGFPKSWTFRNGHWSAS